MAGEHTNQDEIYDLLGVDAGPISIRRIQINLWGTEVLVECEYGGVKPFQLLFEGCKSIEWDTYQEVDEQDKSADALGILLGEGEHHASAIIYTDLFELTVLYNAFTLVKAW